MIWWRKYSDASPDLAGTREIEALVQTEVKRTRRTMASTLEYALEVQDSKLGVMDHSTRVSAITQSIARRVGLNEADRYILQIAARLHELGMFMIPEELLLRPAPLSSTEMRQVRSQAEISAGIARMVHPPRVARLIAHQYEDHSDLVRGAHMEERDVLLAGILRVADVFAAVTWPRTYQDPMPYQLREQLLQRGAGTRFHPVAVSSVLQIGPAPFGTH